MARSRYIPSPRTAVLTGAPTHQPRPTPRRSGTRRAVVAAAIAEG